VTNYKQRGETLTVIAPAALLSGQGVQIGTNLFGIAVNNQNSGDNMEIVVWGVFILPKDASTFTSGAPVYWNNTSGQCTSTATGNLRIGTASLMNPSGTPDPGGLSADPTVTVRLTAAA
jgi:predicted RecA/RadA family phage recombinase